MAWVFHEQQPDWLHNRKGKKMAKAVDEKTALNMAMEAVLKLNVKAEKIRQQRDDVIENACDTLKMTYSDFDSAYRNFLLTKGEAEK